MQLVHHGMFLATLCLFSVLYEGGYVAAPLTAVQRSYVPRQVLTGILASFRSGGLPFRRMSAMFFDRSF